MTKVAAPMMLSYPSQLIFYLARRNSIGKFPGFVVKTAVSRQRGFVRVDSVLAGINEFPNGASA